MGKIFWVGGNLARRSSYGFVGSVFFLLHGDGAILTCYRSEMIRLGMYGKRSKKFLLFLYMTMNEHLRRERERESVIRSIDAV